MKKDMTILITGFEPFGNDILNASFEAVKELPERIGRAVIIKKEIPVVRKESFMAVKQAMEEWKPDAVILTGQAGGRAVVSVEQRAVNLDDYRIPDNAGNQPKNEKVVTDGPEEYRTGLPAEKILERMKAKGIPSELSQSAGTFVCNHLFYLVRHEIETKGPVIPAGFIHVPYMDLQVEQGEKPCLPKEKIVSALEAVIEILQEEYYGTL